MAQRTSALIDHEIWRGPTFRELTPPAQLLYFAIRCAPTTSRAGVSTIAPELWMTARDSTQLGVLTSLAELVHLGYVVVDDVHDELFMADCIRHEQSMLRGTTLERVIRDAEAVRSPALRAAVAAEVRALGIARAVLAADCMDRGEKTPEIHRVSALSRDDLKLMRRQFASCAGRRRVRAEIAAGIHVCAECRAGDQETVDGRLRWLQVDHIVSLAFGGSNDYSNFQVLCNVCNNRKGVGVR